MVKVAVVYYSSTGANHQMASWAAEAAKEAGAEVRLVRAMELAPDNAISANPAWRKHFDATQDIPVATPDDIADVDAIIISTPTRFGNMASQMKQFIDTLGGVWSQGKLVNTLVTAMSSSMNVNGGSEGAIRSIYTSAMHWGSIIVTPGYTDESVGKAGGNPYGVNAVVAGDGSIQNDIEAAVRHQARRVVDVARMMGK